MSDSLIYLVQGAECQTIKLTRSYRYGFGGHEKDNEVKGPGNSLDFEARIYDSRLGRWLSVDPMMKKYPSFSPYNFVFNSPVLFVDPSGKIIHYTSEGGENVMWQYDLMCEVPNNEFVHMVVESLQGISQCREVAKEAIDYLTTNEGITEITYAEEIDNNNAGLDQKHVKWDDMTGSVVKGQNPITVSNMRPPASKLFHELTHSYLRPKKEEWERECDLLEKKYGDGWRETPEGKALLSDARAKMNPADEAYIISSYEGAVSLDMGWGLRIPENGLPSHEIGEVMNYKTEDLLSTEGDEPFLIPSITNPNYESINKKTEKEMTYRNNNYNKQ